jgi:hypothetical protein
MVEDLGTYFHYTATLLILYDVSLQHDFRAALTAGRLVWDKSWLKQSHDHVNTLYHVVCSSLFCLIRANPIAPPSQVESQHPDLKLFANHWATEFLLKESFTNHLGYMRKLEKQLAGALGNTRSASTTRDLSCDGNICDSSDDSVRNSHSHRDVLPSAHQVIAATRQAAIRNTLRNAKDDDDNNEAKKALVRKAQRDAAYRAAEWKAKRKVMDSLDQEPEATPDIESPYNDGETEPEDLPRNIRKAIEHTEIGVPRE